MSLDFRSNIMRKGYGYFVDVSLKKIWTIDSHENCQLVDMVII